MFPSCFITFDHISTCFFVLPFEFGLRFHAFSTGAGFLLPPPRSPLLDTLALKGKCSAALFSHASAQLLRTSRTEKRIEQHAGLEFK